MQPYFLPYLGYFALMEVADVWVFFDNSQFRKRSYMTRNEVLHPAGGRKYIRVETQGARFGSKIMDVAISAKSISGEELIRSLSHYKRAPHYLAIKRFLLDSHAEFFIKGDVSLARFNAHLLTCCCEYLGIRCKWISSSDLDFSSFKSIAPGDWAPIICDMLKVGGYVNPIGGAALFDSKRFTAVGITPMILRFASAQYSVAGFEFEQDLSIVDALMWNSASDVLAMIRRGTAIHALDDYKAKNQMLPFTDGQGEGLTNDSR